MTEPEPLLPPPHDLEAEEIVLSSALWGDAPAHDLGLAPRVFWDDEHRQIWAVVLTAEELLGADVGYPARCWLALRLIPHFGELRLLEILDRGEGWRTVEDCAARLRRLARQRQLLEAMARIEGAWRSGQEASPELLRWTGRRLVRMAEEAT